MKLSLQHLQSLKNKQKLTCLTAYSFPVAKILDEICDIILVGDSLGMVIYGHKDTLDVTLDMMINHGRAVTRATNKAFIVVDLPSNTYENSKEQALEAARKVVQETNCDAIKIETTPALVETAKFLVENGINVMGHIGLLPQHVRELGGYKYQGKDEKSAQEIINTAKKLEKVGVFSLVIEAVPAKLADEITKQVSIPTIGIGASKNCDGQILVVDDMLGLNQEFTPKFVKKFANLADQIHNAAKAYKQEVKSQQFPSSNHEV
ncbi:MAG: 3-methyl-2-oxobutanoate hydroxymethyltransferase [Rickettsiales bacterium]|nr:3-methyl-2-oxobutanoate hydroxymethyltransferase [Rickettsiales bacterium]